MQCAVTKTGSIGCSTDSTQILERADGIFGGGCDGNMRYSKSEIYFSQVDCAALGGRCVASGRTGICTFPSDECSPIVTPDECTGTTFHGCVGGKKTAFDCANIGKACSQVGAVRAACQ
jgi:hypothetical protein